MHTEINYVVYFLYNQLKHLITTNFLKRTVTIHVQYERTVSITLYYLILKHLLTSGRKAKKD